MPKISRNSVINCTAGPRLLPPNSSSGWRTQPKTAWNSREIFSKKCYEKLTAVLRLKFSLNSTFWCQLTWSLQELGKRSKSSIKENIKFYKVTRPNEYLSTEKHRENTSTDIRTWMYNRSYTILKIFPHTLWSQVKKKCKAFILFF